MQCNIVTFRLSIEQFAGDKLANDDLVGLGRFGEAAELRGLRGLWRLCPGVT
jgi:hypothetical protein